MNVRNLLGVIVGITLVTTLGATTHILQLDFAEAGGNPIFARSEASPAISGENVYVAWWTNKTANNNEEIMFRASTDGGAMFGDKINLSNTTNADSWKVE